MSSRARKRFVDDAIEYCSGFDVRVRFVDSITTRGHSFSHGYFCDSERLIVVCSKSRSWFYTFVHEYCHFLQWVSGKFHSRRDHISEQNFWSWLEHEKELPHRKVTRDLKVLRDCEEDCELRSLEIYVNNPKLGVDLKDRYRQANAYIYSFEVAKRHRCWFSRKMPSSCKLILGLMPSNTLASNFTRISRKYELLCVEYCL